MDEQDTGFHDHDVSAGAVAVVSGSVREDRLVLGAPPRPASVHAGGAFSFEASDIHRVQHAGAEPAVTLHAYSPPLWRMGDLRGAAGGAAAAPLGVVRGGAAAAQLRGVNVRRP